MIFLFNCLNNSFVLFGQFLGDDILLHLLNKQITSLNIDMNDKLTNDKSIEYFSIIFCFILKFCRRLTKFHFCSGYYRSETRAVQLSVKNCKSANLVELKVDVDSFDECLYLFDGHFPSLATLILNVKQIKHTSQRKTSTVNIIFVDRHRFLCFLLGKNFQIKTLFIIFGSTYIFL